MSQQSPDEVLRTHRQELRRGTVVAASLAALRTPGYGYALLEELARHGIEVEANTLYPLLRRLEEQALLTSEWNPDQSRPRRVYRTSPAGEQVLTTLLADLEAIRTSLSSITQHPNGAR